MYNTNYSKQTYVIRNSRGRYLREDSNNPNEPVFTDNPESARYWNNSTAAKNYAAQINERYTAEEIFDVWGVPKKVLVCKMTVSTVIEPMPAPNNTTKYRGYTIEASWDAEYKRWEIDAFDDEAQQYVLHPCVKVPGGLEHALEIALNRIDNKLDVDKDRDTDILVYNSKRNYDTTII